MSFEKVKKFAKETGERLIGKGAEVDFRRAVDKETSTRGVPREDAEKGIFSDQLASVRSDIIKDGTIDVRGGSWEGFEAGVHETLPKPMQAKCLEDADDTTIFRAIGTPLSGNPAKVKATLQARFKADYPNCGKTINNSGVFVTEMARNSALMGQLMSRMDSDLHPHMSSGASLESILGTYPEIGADIGKAEQVRDLLKKQESILVRKMGYGRSVDNFKEYLHKSIFEDFGKGLRKWGGDLSKGLFGALGGDFKPFFKYLKTSMVGTFKGVGRLGVLVGKSLNVGAQYLNSLRK